MHTNHPVTTVRTIPAAPIPLWARHHLFLEPVYADGRAYDQPAPDPEDQNDDGERPAA
ncbi:hypothetical protein ACWY4P_53485 (plasmid) [Streptomyces sp. LZ34]